MHVPTQPNVCLITPVSKCHDRLQCNKLGLAKGDQYPYPFFITTQMLQYSFPNYVYLNAKCYDKRQLSGSLVFDCFLLRCVGVGRLGEQDFRSPSNLIEWR